VNINDIINVELSNRVVAASETIKYLSPFKSFEDPNTIIYLNKPYTIAGMYGSKKTFETLAMHIDEKAFFKSQIDDCLLVREN
jgi:hypothetical protein